MTQYSERPRFDIGRVIERTFGVVGHNIVPFLLFAVVLNGLPGAGLQYLRYQASIGAISWHGSYLVYAIVAVVIWVIASLILQGALLRGALDDLNGDKVSMSEMFQAGVRNSPKLLAIGILFCLALGLGLLVLIVPGLFLLVLFSVTYPAAVSERTGVFESFGRSIRLTENHRWAVFGLGVIFLVLTLIVSTVFGGVLIGLSMGMGMDVQLVATIFNPIVSVIEIIVGTVAYAALYHELRAAKEGAASRSVAGVFD